MNRAQRRNGPTKVKSENGPKNELAKSALLLFFGAIIIELVRVSASVAVLAVTRFFMGNCLVLSVRPRIAELVFQLYGRSLHPELFEVHRSRQIERGGYTATCRSRTPAMSSLGSMTASRSPKWPRRPSIRCRNGGGSCRTTLKGKCTDELECRGGVTYQVEFSLEPVERETFWTYQKELTEAGTRDGLLHCFESSGRIRAGALSYINLESRDRSLKVQAFHTFPDDYAIVKSQSVFSLPKK